MCQTHRVELYHALNRGVEKRNIFLDNQDYLRFVHDLWEFNDENDTSHAHHSFKKNLGLRNPNWKTGKIVDIHAWCLMKNHYHLLLSGRKEGGLSLFLRKLNVGYANYFNERYSREGALFQGRTKKIRIASDAHFLHIINYIHLNPLDYGRSTEKWREREIRSIDEAEMRLKNYPWSSYNDYCGRKKFPSVISTQLFGDKNFERRTLDYLQGMQSENTITFSLE